MKREKRIVDGATIEAVPFADAPKETGYLRIEKDDIFICAFDITDKRTLRFLKKHIDQMLGVNK